MISGLHEWGVLLNLPILMISTNVVHRLDSALLVLGLLNQDNVINEEYVDVVPLV